MKRSIGALAGLGVGIWLASCGGGTLGGGLPTGGGGNFTITGSAGAAGRGTTGGAPGFGGDNAPGGGRGGGRGGARGGGGLGGSASICISPGAPVCGARCGNGTRDTCVPTPSPGCPAQTVTEQCDRDDFGSDSCAVRGYGSGKLICAADCTTDDGACSECGLIGGPVVRCGPAPGLVLQPFWFALGATDTEIGLATLADNGNGGTTLSFARLAPSLDLVGGWVDLEETSQFGAPVGNSGIYAVAVAPLLSGWVVAACGNPDVFIHLIDAAGRQVSRTVVDRVANPYDACVSGMMTLAARPGGGPLLLWRSGSDLFGSLIADDGMSAGTRQTIVGTAAFFSDIVSAAWVGDAFYVAATIRRDGGDYRPVLRLVRLQPGSAPTGGDVLVNEPFYGPAALTSGAGDLRVLYASIPPGGVEGIDYAVLWRRLGPSGQPLSEPVVVGTPPDTFGSSLGVAFEMDTVVVIGGGLYGGRLALGRLGSDGQVAAPFYDLARTPNYYLGDFEMVRRGPDVVVGWRTTDLRLARVTP